MDATTDKVQSHVGELLALKALCIAIIATHPDPDELQRVFSDTTDVILTRMLQDSSFSQTTIRGLRELTHAINETMRSRMLHGAEPDQAR